jgi:hypothetical protein
LKTHRIVLFPFGIAQLPHLLIRQDKALIPDRARASGRELSGFCGNIVLLEPIRQIDNVHIPLCFHWSARQSGRQSFKKPEINCFFQTGNRKRAARWWGWSRGLIPFPDHRIVHLPDAGRNEIRAVYGNALVREGPFRDEWLLYDTCRCPVIIREIDPVQQVCPGP